MRIDLHFVTGFMVGFELAPDPDFGGTCILMDLGIVRCIIAFPGDEE